MTSFSAFVSKHWVALIAMAAGAAVNWAQWSYVSEQVNPETVQAFRVEQARLDARREVRWCLGKAALENKSALQALHCAD